MNEAEARAVEAELDRTAGARTAELSEFCSIASERDNPGALDAAVSWVRDRLASAGATVRLVEVEGAPPLVVGEVGRNPSRTINAVQHYDVQPAGDWSSWTSPPYEPQVREGRLYARGASDNKGEFLLRVWAAEAYARAIGELPCSIRFLVEGEEESGSQHLDAMLDSQPELRAAYAALGEAGGVDEVGRPLVTAGNRGMLMVRLTARTLSRDAHSGAAALLPNAAARLVAALSTLVKADGAPAWDGLMDGVAPLSPAARAAVAGMPLDLLDQVRSEFNVSRFVEGRDGVEAFEADLSRPTCNIQAIWSGDTQMERNVVPAEATARIDMRLVPNQDPARIKQLLREHLDRHGFEDVAMEQVSMTARAYWTDLGDPIIDAAARAVEATFGKDAIREQSMGGTAPMYQVCGPNEVPMVFIGGADIRNNAHAANESISLATARSAAVAFLRFLENVAQL